VNLVGCTIGIYYDTRSYERQNHITWAKKLIVPKFTLFTFYIYLLRTETCRSLSIKGRRTDTRNSL